MCVCVRAWACRRMHTHGLQVKGCGREGSGREGGDPGHRLWRRLQGPELGTDREGWSRAGEKVALLFPDLETRQKIQRPRSGRAHHLPRSPRCGSGGRGRMKGFTPPGLPVLQERCIPTLLVKLKTDSSISAPKSSADSKCCQSCSAKAQAGVGLAEECLGRGLTGEGKS